MNRQLRIVLLGDSITEGIGSKKINYTVFLKEQLNKYKINCEIHNLALTGTTVEYGLKKIDQVKSLAPDFIVIMYGAVDLQVRPNMESNRFGILNLTPNRYKRIKGMLNPRPFCSSKFPRKLFDNLDDIYRKLWKRVVIKTQGTMQIFNNDEFEKKYEDLIKALSEYKLVICSPIYLDASVYSIQSLNNYLNATQFMQKIANDSKNIGFVDLYNIFKREIKHGWSKVYLNDHFHPNSNGYKIIAEKIMLEIETMI